jgi:pyruvate dehydrogenase E2 component (dihydrolipoyllysine-residue acetyltransferase)
MDVLMPQLGETVAEGKISKWFVSTGDTVKPGDNLFEIETDKVSMDVPAIAAGTLSVINVAAGETAPVGAVVAIILGADEKGPSAGAAPPTPPPLVPAQAGIRKPRELGARLRGDERQASTEILANAPRAAIPMEPFREVRTPERNYGPARLAGGTIVTPLARRLAGEAGIDLSNVTGSGPHGRIVARDVETARAKAPALARGVAAEQTQTIPHIVLTADVEIGLSLVLCDQVNAAARKKDGAPVFNLSLGDVIIKAWAAALARVPAANAVWMQGRALPAEHSDIAIVLGASRPVIHNVENKSLSAIATMRRDLAARARDGTITADETQGGSTAISYPGVPGIAAIAEVIRPPHATMLSVGAPRRAPVEAPDGAVKFVSVLTVTLSCDHRVVDGALGAELLSALKGFVEQPVTMIV